MPGNKRRRTGVVLLTCLAFVALAAQAVQLSAVRTDKSEIAFVSTQMGVPVTGRFRKFTAQVSFDPATPEAGKARIDIELASIDAGSKDANEEVRGKKWFDVQSHPTASFVAHSMKALGGGNYEVRGPLTVKGRTREIVASFGLKQVDATARIEGAFPFKRSEFGIGEGAWADPSVVADEVEVRFRLIAE